MPAENHKQNCDQTWLSHKQSMLIIAFVGTIAVLGMLFCGITLVVILWNNNQKELAIITGLIGAISNPISLCIGVLIPSPLSSANRRGTDQSNVIPEGTPRDPISTQEVKADSVKTGSVKDDANAG